MLTTSLLLIISLAAQQNQAKTSYSPNGLPATTEDGQTGTNICTNDSQSSMCQTAWVNSLQDFCLWGPPNPNSAIGDTEAIEIAWCTASGHGTRIMPVGTITGAHYVETPEYIQITGKGNFAQININNNGGGGELDPHGATGSGNPIGGLVFSTNPAYNGVNIQEWTNFMSESEFCIRVCKPVENAALRCQHIYDVMGCAWNNPGDYDAGAFDTCDGTSNGFPGIDNGVTFYQDAGMTTPPPHAAGPTSNCVKAATIFGGAAQLYTAPAVVSTVAIPITTTTASSSTSTDTTTSTTDSSTSTTTTTSSSVIPSSTTVSSVAPSSSSITSSLLKPTTSTTMSSATLISTSTAAPSSTSKAAAGMRNAVEKVGAGVVGIMGVMMLV